MRTPFIAGNWKMFKTVAEAVEFAGDFIPRVAGINGVEIVICPPFTAIYALRQQLHGTGIKLGGQNVFWEEWGAYTGEVSGPMLKEAGCEYVIIGHSERRRLLGESDAGVNRKIKHCLASGICPILCVGETLDERKAGKARQVVEKQIASGLAEVDLQGLGLIVAYEPVWAIGTGVNASAEDAQEMSSFIRTELAARLGENTAGLTRILYGGSVKPPNIKEFTAQPDIDGALVGGASLEPESLAAIVKYTEETTYGK